MFLRKLVFACAAVCCVMSASFIRVSTPVYAAATNPTVLAIKDITSTSSCHHTYGSHVNTPQVVTTTTACAPGTILHPTSMLLSSAQAQHFSYLASLPAHATVQQQAQFEQQVIALEAQVRDALQKPLLISATVHPNTVCSGQYSQGVTWSEGSIYEKDSVDNSVWYTFTSCTSLVLNYGTFKLYSDPNRDGAEWDAYAYGSDKVANCTSVNSVGGSASYTDTYHAQQRNLYFLAYDTELANDCFPASKSNQVDIGPLN